jgi:hypothetical protein
MDSEHELYALMKKIRYDLTALQAKVTDAFAMLDALKLPVPASEWICKECAGGYDLKGERALALHRQNVHDGPPVEPTELEELELAAHGDSSNDSEPVT